MHPMRIGLVTPYGLDPPGGVQQYVLELGARLEAVGHGVHIVAPGQPTVAGVTTVGATRPIAANGSVAHITVDPRAFGKTRRALDDVDVVHVHEPLMPVVGVAAARTRRPTLATFHADPSVSVKRIYRGASFVLRRLLGRVERATAVSPTAAAAIRPVVGDIPVIPNAIDAARYRPAGIGRIQHRVAFLGRDDERKGLDVLLAAWPRILDEVPTATLDVIGASRASMPGVRFLGRVSEDDKVRALAEAAVFCAPNLGGESFGITVVEALAAGCAIVASDLAAFRWVADDAARYVARGDAMALATAVIGRLADPDLAAAEAVSAARAGAFDWSEVLPRYLEIYHELAPGRV